MTKARRTWSCSNTEPSLPFPENRPARGRRTGRLPRTGESVKLSKRHMRRARIAYFAPTDSPAENTAVFQGWGRGGMKALPYISFQSDGSAGPPGAPDGGRRREKRGKADVLSTPYGRAARAFWNGESRRQPVFPYISGLPIPLLRPTFRRTAHCVPSSSAAEFFLILRKCMFRAFSGTGKGGFLVCF